jgi:hypothetical protein
MVVTVVWEAGREMLVQTDGRGLDILYVEEASIFSRRYT